MSLRLPIVLRVLRAPLPATRLARAKRRALRRRASSGGTMFVVAMTLAVLSTLGAWALQSAALEVRMAGYERQSTQTHYLAEYGLVAATQDVSPITLPLIFTAAMSGVPSGTTTAHAACASLPCVNFTTSPVTVNSACGELANATLVTMGCWRWEMSTFGPGFSVPTTNSLLDSPDGGTSGVAGSLGATSTQGNISAEMTDFVDTATTGGFSGPMCSYWGTVSAYGQTLTTGATTNQGQGTEQLRARLQIGPIPGGCK
jgi:hypothetical protein